MDLSTPIATKVTGVVGLLAVAGLGWTFALGPETSQLAETRAEITSVRDQNAVLATQLAALEKQQAELGSVRQEARELAEKFPPTADQPGLFAAITDAAIDAGIGAQGVTTLAPTPPVVAAPVDPAADAGTDAAAATGTTGAGALARQTVTVVVTGTYDQTERLLENLEHMSRAYLVTSVSLSGESGTFATTVAGDMFVMPPVKDPGKTLNLASSTQPEG